MKRQIRNSVFETNSSSTHSIAISKAPVTIGKYIHFGIGEYGWENACVDIADYLYTAILEQNESDELLDRLKEILNNHSIEYEFEEPSYHESVYGDCKYLDYGYIDHSDETREFIFAVLDDEDLLMRCLFGDSCVYTGNDNQDCEPSGCNIADEIIWEYENGKYIEKSNPHHDPENYDYFYKGN
ncbi:MAG: hypothetical protein PUC23_03515 [bacterium]|nr:hypothetical protein [bacterium]